MREAVGIGQTAEFAVRDIAARTFRAHGTSALREISHYAAWLARILAAQSRWRRWGAAHRGHPKKKPIRHHHHRALMGPGMWSTPYEGERMATRSAALQLPFAIAMTLVLPAPSASQAGEPMQKAPDGAMHALPGGAKQTMPSGTLQKSPASATPEAKASVKQTAPTFVPKTVTAGQLTMTGTRFQPKSVTSGNLTVTGTRFQPKTLTSAGLTMTGTREALPPK
ncbi:MAG TPA: hypothetical protein VED01_02315 [Burkholderiales bacterium]|nr:hypothetical protein [Burkholderiales bacterium]